MFQIGPEITVAQDGREPSAYPVHTRVCELPDTRQDPHGLGYLGALVNNEAVTMSYRLEVDSRVRLLTLRDRAGWRIYRNSVAFLLAATVQELFPDADFAVEHSLGSGFYCSFGRGAGRASARRTWRGWKPACGNGSSGTPRSSGARSPSSRP